MGGFLFGLITFTRSHTSVDFLCGIRLSIFLYLSYRNVNIFLGSLLLWVLSSRFFKYFCGGI